MLQIKINVKYKDATNATNVTTLRMTTNTYSGNFPVSLPNNSDNGLGFGQGSTDGVYNQYPRGGFHRPLSHSMPEFDTLDRRNFNRNFAGKCDSYKCTYDPDKFYKQCKIPQKRNTYVLGINNIEQFDSVNPVNPVYIDQRIAYAENSEITPLSEANDANDANKENLEPMQPMQMTPMTQLESVDNSYFSKSLLLNGQINNVFFIIISIVAFFFLFNNYSF